jgi:hypothetical protein
MWSWLFIQPVASKRQPDEAADGDLTPQDRFALRVQLMVLAQPACSGLAFYPR